MTPLFPYISKCNFPEVNKLSFVYSSFKGVADVILQPEHHGEKCKDSCKYLMNIWSRRTESVPCTWIARIWKFRSSTVSIPPSIPPIKACPDATLLKEIELIYKSAHLLLPLWREVSRTMAFILALRPPLIFSKGLVNEVYCLKTR